MAGEMTQAMAYPSTPSFLNAPQPLVQTPQQHKDDMSTVASDILKSEEAQMNIALQNSMKSTYSNHMGHPSTHTPEGVSIEELRTKRRLFRSCDSEYLKHRKMGMDQTNVIHIDQTPPSAFVPPKARNRLSNNGLDPAYFAMTQQYNDSPITTSVASSKAQCDPSFEQSIRIEVLRQMQAASDTLRPKASKLYRILNRKKPEDEYSDIQSIAMDCDHCGKTVEETVLLMLAIIE